VLSILDEGENSIFNSPRNELEMRPEQEDFQCSEVKMLMTSEMLATGGTVILSAAVGIAVSSQPHPDRMWDNIQPAH
jgi:hypothetical protein